ncbi:MAG TPA: O-antigen ligase family protein [Thermoanaerobaculia bacterium]|jgi:putative inorganic carbon (HCO3(-)) transporter|nr:O-antigen ligase family protein [Thermoanaerobaculia bacterium]
MAVITTSDVTETAASPAAAFVSGEWIALAILSPFFFFPPIGNPVLTVILVLPAVWIVPAVAGRELVPLTAFNGSLALLLLAVLASLSASFDVLFSAPKVLGVIFGVAVFFALVRTIRERASLDFVVRAFSVAGGLLALVGLLGTDWIHKIVVLRSITSRLPAVIRGVPGQAEGFQPNAIAGALVMFIPLQFALATGETSLRQRRAHWAMFFISGVTLLLTQSRGGYLGLAVGCLAWAMWHSRRSRLFAGVSLLFAAIAVAPLWHRIAPFVFGSIGAGVATDVDSRFELWSRAISMIADFPITGVGMNGFRRVMPAMYPVLLTPLNVDVAHAHNHLLQVALDVGLPGLVAYLALWCGAAALLTGTYRRQDRRGRWIVSGLAAGMIAYFTFGASDAIALGAKVGIFFWVVLGLIVAQRRVAA